MQKKFRLLFKRGVSIALSLIIMMGFSVSFDSSVMAAYSAVPRISAAASSNAGSGWEGAKAIDISSTSAWSSQVHSSDSFSEWIYMDMGSSYNVSQVRVIPRIANNVVYCFPKDFKFQSSNDAATWSDISGQSYTNYPTPATAAEITFAFSSPVSCRYIRLYATKLSADNYNNYYCQIAELNADYDSGSTPAPGSIDGYTWCANENGSYTSSVPVDVAFGANGQYNFKYGVTGTINFNTATFGDPVSGVVKAGYYKVSTGSTPAPDPGGAPAGYIRCAFENGSYSFSAPTDVAYGANRNFVYRYGVTGSITFDNANFGEPAPGVSKAGYYKIRGGDTPAPCTTKDLCDDTAVRSAVQISQTTDTAAMKFTAEAAFNAVDVQCPSWGNNTGNLTLKLFVWNTDYNTTIQGTPLESQTFANFIDNSYLKLTFATKNAGQYLWQLSSPTETVGVWKCTNSNNTNISYINGAQVTGDYVSRIYYLDNSYCEPSGYPFVCDAPNGFTTDINKMWSIYGAVNDGTNAVLKFGNEPTYFDWVATKIMWSNESTYKNDLKEKIRDFAIGSEGYVWSWANQDRWPSGNSLHFGNNINYIIAVYKILSWENSTSFLNAVDTDTTATGDVSQGKTVGQKVDLAMNYILNTLNGANGLMIINNGENTGKADGHASNYWDNHKFGYKDGYSNIYYYQALLSMSGIEVMRGNQANAVYYANLAATAKNNYDTTFYNAAKGRYASTIDTTGHVWDLGFTFVSLEALANGLGDSTKAASIFSWLNGSRTIAGDTSTGADIYSAFKYAPRVNTLAIESTGAPYWWNDCGGAIPVTGTGSWGQHCENGGTIFYTSYYDLLARAKYLGANDAKGRFNAIMTEFKSDELRRDRANSYGATWLEGVIGEFPESGLVPSAFLYTFVGVDVKADGLHIYPNIPDDMTYAMAKDVNYGGVKYSITAKKDKQIIFQTADGGTSTLNGKVGNLTPNTAYTIYNYDLANGTNTVASVTTDSDGTVAFSQSVAGKRRIVIQ